MRYLLDTHTFLWFIDENSLLSKDAKNLIESDIDIWLSIASLWEIAIKNNIGKLDLPKPFPDFIPEQLKINDIEILPISINHLNTFVTLPKHHKDPFDRLLIAQSITENVSIISRDSIFDLYAINRFW